MSLTCHQSQLLHPRARRSSSLHRPSHRRERSQGSAAVLECQSLVSPPATRRSPVASWSTMCTCGKPSPPLPERLEVAALLPEGHETSCLLVEYKEASRPESPRTLSPSVTRRSCLFCLGLEVPVFSVAEGSRSPTGVSRGLVFSLVTSHLISSAGVSRAPSHIPDCQEAIVFWACPSPNPRSLQPDGRVGPVTRLGSDRASSCSGGRKISLPSLSFNHGLLPFLPSGMFYPPRRMQSGVNGTACLGVTRSFSAP